nr:uncharacterized protein LOC113729262 [Coffea arabica]
MDRKNTEATADWIAKKLVPVMRIHPNMSTKGVEAEMIKYGVHPSKWQMYRALTKARNEIEGPFGGVLLTAVTLDANNSIFPIAFVVAEVENKETWSWFFHSFEEFFGPFRENGPLTFMSDRQKGLNITYDEIVPVASERHCCRHICSNFKAQFPGILLSNLFWRAVKSFDVAGHNEAMASIKELNIELKVVIVEHFKFQDFLVQKLESYCEHWFSRDMYLKTYASMIHLIPDEKMWPPRPHVTPATILPPPLRRAPGRPKVKRRREHDEGQSASQPKRWSRFKCGNCGSFGHNKKSCQGAPVQNKKNGNRTSGQQDHASGDVPVVHSSQGSNPSPSSQPVTVNMHVQIQSTTTTSKKKRGRSLSNTGASARGSSKRNNSNTIQIT